jgi:hypothetical protein
MSNHLLRVSGITVLNVLIGKDGLSSIGSLPCLHFLKDRQEQFLTFSLITCLNFVTEQYEHLILTLVEPEVLVFRSDLSFALIL